ncbi:hypothetical protein, partial [Saccharothrix hoggarensis]
MERYAAVFEVADPPRTSTVAFYPDDARPVPVGPEPARAEVVASGEDGVGRAPAVPAGDSGETSGPAARRTSAGSPAGGPGDRLTIAGPDGARRTVP